MDIEGEKQMDSKVFYTALLSAILSLGLSSMISACKDKRTDGTSVVSEAQPQENSPTLKDSTQIRRERIQQILAQRQTSPTPSEGDKDSDAPSDGSEKDEAEKIFDPKKGSKAEGTETTSNTPVTGKEGSPETSPESELLAPSQEGPQDNQDLVSNEAGGLAPEERPLEARTEEDQLAYYLGNLVAINTDTEIDSDTVPLYNNKRAYEIASHIVNDRNIPSNDFIGLHQYLLEFFFIHNNLPTQTLTDLEAAQAAYKMLFYTALDTLKVVDTFNRYLQSIERSKQQSIPKEELLAIIDAYIDSIRSESVLTLPEARLIGKRPGEA